MPDAIVAGHLCLDIIPLIKGGFDFQPGALIEVGAARLSTGGAVSNTGTAMHKLGVDVRLMGKISDDLFGRAIVEHLGELGNGLIVAPGEPSSYTIVLNLSGQDRMFLHAPGCNDTFASQDVPDEAFAGARLLHFGYPTLMARMFADDGEELVDLFARAKGAGLVTSLDVSLPDPDSRAGRADWRRILERVLPYTDLFLPSLGEAESMLGPVQACADDRERSVGELARKILDLGAKVAVIKAGERGLFLLTHGFEHWHAEELWAAPFQVDVRGTTGAGDATIAGLLRAFLAGESAAVAATEAVAVGAFCCEQPDAVSGIKSLADVRARIGSGWKRLGSP